MRSKCACDHISLRLIMTAAAAAAALIFSYRHEAGMHACMHDAEYFVSRYKHILTLQKLYIYSN